MHPSFVRRAPTITILSPSPLASRKAQQLLVSLGLVEPSPLVPAEKDDPLNKPFLSALPFVSRVWDSVSCTCPTTGTLLHFLSLCDPRNASSHQRTQQDESHEGGNFELLALTNSIHSSSNSQTRIDECRHYLASRIASRSTAIKLSAMCRSRLSLHDVVKSESKGGLPLIQLPDADEEMYFDGDAGVNNLAPTGLKEVVVPYFDYASYVDGSTLISKLTDADLHRPVVGLYHWGNSLTTIRPLPTSAEDQTLSSASLVFHRDSQDELDLKGTSAKVAKIGYGGHRVGQVMLAHEDLLGLDIRFCSSKKHETVFSESQEALLAASLMELQSTNALLAGGEKAKHDQRLGKADCWIELRSNLKRPAGFLNRASRSPSSSNTAKAPDLPFE